MSAKGCLALVNLLEKDPAAGDEHELLEYIQTSLQFCSLWWTKPSTDQLAPVSPPWIFDLVRLDHLLYKRSTSTYDVYRSSHHTCKFFGAATISLSREVFMAEKVPTFATDKLYHASSTINILLDHWLQVEYENLSRHEIVGSVYHYLVPAGIRTLLRLRFFYHDRNCGWDGSLYMAIHLATAGIWAGRSLARRWLSTPHGIGTYLKLNDLENPMPIQLGAIWQALDNYFELIRYNKQGPCAECSKPAAYNCSRCTTVFYCTTKCQRRHWTNHRLECALHQEIRALHIASLGPYHRFIKYLKFYRTTIGGDPSRPGLLVLIFSNKVMGKRLQLNPSLKYVGPAQPSTATNISSCKCGKCLYDVVLDGINVCASVYQVSWAVPSLENIFERYEHLYRWHKDRGSECGLLILVQEQDDINGVNWMVYYIQK